MTPNTLLQLATDNLMETLMPNPRYAHEDPDEGDDHEHEPQHEKYAKGEVKYGPGECCGICIHYEPGEDHDTTGQCELVKGSIGIDMWCSKFRKRNYRRKHEDHEEQGETEE
jgi:hypothetical protein